MKLRTCSTYCDRNLPSVTSHLGLSQLASFFIFYCWAHTLLLSHLSGTEIITLGSGYNNRNAKVTLVWYYCLGLHSGVYVVHLTSSHHVSILPPFILRNDEDKTGRDVAKGKNGAWFTSLSTDCYICTIFFYGFLLWSCLIDYSVYRKRQYT